MSPKRKIDRRTAKSWVGMPVCAVLNDGTYYIGRLEAVGKRDIVLSGFKGEGNLRGQSSQANRAYISGFLGSLFGGGGGSGGLGGFGGLGGLGGLMNGVGMLGRLGGLGGGFGGLGGLGGFGGGGAGAAAGAAAGGGGFIGRWWPHIRMGLGVVQTIMPLMNMFRV